MDAMLSEMNRVSHQSQVENASTQGADGAVLAYGVKFPVQVVAKTNEIGPTTRDDTKRGRQGSEEILPPPLAKRVLVALDAANGGLVTVDELIDAAYGDREDGGPLNATCIVRATIMGLRGIGASIDSVKGFRVSRTRCGLSRLDSRVVDAIDASRGIGGRREIGRSIGMEPNHVSVVINRIRSEGIDVQALAGYRLRKPGVVGVVAFTRPEPRRAPVDRRRGVEADALRVLAVLDQAGGRPLSMEEIHARAFSHCVDGGPKEGVRKALSWLGDRGADIRRAHGYYLPTSGRCTVTGPACLRIVETIRSGHHDIESIAAAAGMTAGAKMKLRHKYEIESRFGYVLHITAFDPIHQLAA